MNPICPNCGVELDEAMQTCPLCNYSDFTSVHESNEPDPVPGIRQKKKVINGYVKLTPVQKRKLFWEVSGIILVSAMVGTLLIDIIFNKGITWSKYSSTICMVLFVNITLISFLRKHLFLLICGSFISTSGLLILFDLFKEGTGWGMQLGMPMLFSVYLIVIFLGILFRFMQQHGFNMLACLFLAGGFLSLCTDGILSRYLTGRLTFHWSLIVLVCIIPIVAILFYIHYRLKKGVELRQFFHI